MHSFHSLQADMQRLVNRSAGCRKNADDFKGPIVMQCKTRCGHTVRQYQLVADLLIEPLRYLRTQHHIKQRLKRLPLSECQRM